ncbi:MAG: NAD(P)/FAD-dependent oxidoreductase [Bacteroidales bacterium]|nr:NAD(P)/FAD-dependent oxidoreductase [Bacteroidales bacterium]
MKYDIIIIGAGLGGLTAGAKLAREGKKVLVIEQHDRPGGCATTFKRRNFTLEVGLHELHGPSPTELKSKIFNELDVFDHVKFVRVPEFYRFINDRYDVTVPHEPETAIERLTGLFPQETDGIKAYFDQLLNPRKKGAEMEGLDKSVGDFLDSIIRDEDLKLILLGNLGYFHDDPYSLSMAYYTIAQGSYFKGGASYIKGGSQNLSDYLADYIRNHNGEVLLNHMVTGIKADNNKITGVQYKRKNDFASDYMEVHADDIIANAAIPNITDLLPVEMGMKLKNSLNNKKIGTSLLTIYFGFSKPLKELGNSHYSTFVFDSSIRSQADILSNNMSDFSKRIFTFIDYSRIDSGLAPEGKGTGVICCIDYIKDWEDLDKKEYYAKKEQVASVFIERLEKLIPGIKDVTEYVEMATSVTVKRYTLNPSGAVYGFAQTPSGTPVDVSGLPDNLHFASAWGKTGGGFSGAIYGGYLCAVNLLRKNRG